LDVVLVAAEATAMDEEQVATAADKIETSKQLLKILESSFETKVST